MDKGHEKAIYWRVNPKHYDIPTLPVRQISDSFDIHITNFFKLSKFELKNNRTIGHRNIKWGGWYSDRNMNYNRIWKSI